MYLQLESIAMKHLLHLNPIYNAYIGLHFP